MAVLREDFSEQDELNEEVLDEIASIVRGKIDEGVNPTSISDALDYAVDYLKNASGML